MCASVLLLVPIPVLARVPTVLSSVQSQAGLSPGPRLPLVPGPPLPGAHRCLHTRALAPAPARCWVWLISWRLH